MLYQWTTPRSARNRHSHLNQLQKMNRNMNTQTTLDLNPVTVDVEAFIGLTDWKLTTEQPPPYRGWWKTRDLTSPHRLPNQRRWWNGKFWSVPVVSDDSFDHKDLLEAAEDFKTCLPNGRIEWCGLKESYPGGYPYKLRETPMVGVFAPANTEE